jgi:hypothetical protein
MLWEYELYFGPNVGNPVVAMYVQLYRSAVTEIFIFLARISAGPLVCRKVEDALDSLEKYLGKIDEAASEARGAWACRNSGIGAIICTSERPRRDTRAFYNISADVALRSGYR